MLGARGWLAGFPVSVGRLDRFCQHRLNERLESRAIHDLAFHPNGAFEFVHQRVTLKIATFNSGIEQIGVDGRIEHAHFIRDPRKKTAV